jgi:hypothetical protein
VSLCILNHSSGIFLVLFFSVLTLLEFQYLIRSVIKSLRCLYHVGIICRTMIISFFFFFLNSHFSAVILPKIFANLTRFFLEYSCWFSFCRIMSAISSQCRVRQRIEAEQNEIQEKIMDRTVIAERNVVRVDIMVPPLNSIHETIQHYQWTYLYTCACVVLTRLVRLFLCKLGGCSG